MPTVMMEDFVMDRRSAFRQRNLGWNGENVSPDLSPVRVDSVQKSSGVKLNALATSIVMTIYFVMVRKYAIQVINWQTL
jgi:hypothetical protein